MYMYMYIVTGMSIRLKLMRYRITSLVVYLAVVVSVLEVIRHIRLVRATGGFVQTLRFDQPVFEPIMYGSILVRRGSIPL